MVSATTSRVLLVALALAGLAAVDAAVPEGSDRLAAVDAAVKADEARGRELSLTDEKMERKCAMAETEDECNDMKKKFKCKWHERSLSDPNKSGCKTEPNYKKLYKECLKRWDMKDLGQGGPPDPPPDPPPEDDCECSSPATDCLSNGIRWRETIRLAATTVAAWRRKDHTIEHLLHRRLLRGRHTLVGLPRHDMDGLQRGAAQPRAQPRQPQVQQVLGEQEEVQEEVGEARLPVGEVATGRSRPLHRLQEDVPGLP